MALGLGDCFFPPPIGREQQSLDREGNSLWIPAASSALRWPRQISLPRCGAVGFCGSGGCEWEAELSRSLGAGQVPEEQLRPFPSPRMSWCSGSHLWALPGCAPDRT